MDLSIKSIISADQDEFAQQVRYDEKRIDRIKQDIAQEYDNISNPVPFLPALRTR